MSPSLKRRTGGDQLAVLAGDPQRGGGQLGRDGVPGVLKPIVRWISAVLPQMPEICEVVSPDSTQPSFAGAAKAPGRRADRGPAETVRRGRGMVDLAMAIIFSK